MSLRAVVCIFVLLAFGLVSLAISQRSSSQQSHRGMNHNLSVSTQPTGFPPGTIDGAKNPESISDFKAYEVFFNSVAVASRATNSEKFTARDMFSRAKLSEPDTGELMKILAEFHQSRSNIAAQAAKLTPRGASDADFAQLHSQLEALVSSTQQTVRLSPEGATKIHQHVLGLKRKIKIVPGPPK